MLSHYLLPMLIPSEAMPQTNKIRLEPRISQIAQILDFYLCNLWFQYYLKLDSSPFLRGQACEDKPQIKFLILHTIKQGG